MLVRDGFAAMTTERVAEEAGVAVGTIYRYYPAKDALVRAMAERMHDLALADLTAGLSAVVAQPDRLVTPLIALAVSVGNKYAPELAAWAELAPHLGANAYASNKHQLIDILEQVMIARRDRMDVPDPRLAAFVVVTCVVRTVIAAAAFRRESLADGTLQHELERLVTGYLRISPDPGTGDPLAKS